MSLDGNDAEGDDVTVDWRELSGTEAGEEKEEEDGGVDCLPWLFLRLTRRQSESEEEEHRQFFGW